MADERPEWVDLRITFEDSDVGFKSMTITAYTQQAEIDLAMEAPRIKKLLERDWETEGAE